VARALWRHHPVNQCTVTRTTCPNRRPGTSLMMAYPHCGSDSPALRRTACTTLLRSDAGQLGCGYPGRVSASATHVVARPVSSRPRSCPAGAARTAPTHGTRPGRGSAGRPPARPVAWPERSGSSHTWSSGPPSAGPGHAARSAGRTVGVAGSGWGGRTVGVAGSGWGGRTEVTGRRGGAGERRLRGWVAWGHRVTG
jgi:hypothetical protein